MGRTEVSFKNRDKFVQLGVAISALRRLQGLSQEQLAEKACISRSHLSAIEAPGIVRGLSLNTFYNLADALNVDPSDLVLASVLPEKMIGHDSYDK